MAEYICKDCENNNHGWCKVKLRNKLKEIKECEDKRIKGYLSEAGQKEYNKTVDELYKEAPAEKRNEINTEQYKVYGKREMFYHIQRQIEAMPKECSIEDLKKVLLSLNQALNIEEAIHGIAVDYMIDQDIINHSKAICEEWGNQGNE